MSHFDSTLEGYIQSNDTSAMSALLKDIAKIDVSKSELWKHRKYYRCLSDEQIENSPILCTALALIETLSADLGKADKYIQLLHKMQEKHHKNSCAYKEIELQLRYIDLALPQMRNKSPMKALKSLVQAAKEDSNSLFPVPSISSGRPSIVNGGRDFTGYWKFANVLKPIMQGFAKVLYGDSGIGMPEMTVAEWYYYNDKISDSLIQTVSIIPFIEQSGDVNTLFVAMYLQMRIMMVSGQIPSARPMLNNIEEKIRAAGAEHLLPNLNAVYAWIALYDNDFEMINKWLKQHAPDETAEFCTLDRFQYFVKLRVYLVQGKHIAFLGLAERIRPILVAFDRKMEMCELDMLYALSLYAQDEKDKAFDVLEVALIAGEKYHYDRLFGDEGEKLYFLLCNYKKQRKSTPFLEKVIDLTKKIALIYPHYLKAHKELFPLLTQTEVEVVRLMAAEKTNEEIAKFLNISINTVKFHSKNIFSKLDVKNRSQAVKTARDVEII